MTSVGIVAEFNPFHNGHSYLIQKAKELTGADCAVVVMSGDFVQRGECAVFDKYFRAKCALLGGADLVVMLPVNISTASSETFAAGAVRILAKSGVNFIAFGCETVTNDTLDELSSLAAFLNNEPSDFKNNLSSHLKSGLTYPKARRLAMSESFDDSVLRYLDTPNNLLAIDYIKALQKYKLSMKPVPIQRLGDEYHATSTKLFMSSTAIREYLKCNNYSSCNLSPEILERISDDAAGKLPLFSNDCTPFMNMQLFNATSKNADLTLYDYIDRKLANRMQKHFIGRMQFTELCDTLKSKDVTYTHISRALTRLMLDIKGCDTSCMYIRLLGMNQTGIHYLSTIKKALDIPIITKVSTGLKKIDSPGYIYFENDCRASHLYKEMVYNKYGVTLKTDYETSPYLSF